MKIGQSLEYTNRNIFLEKLYTKCGGKTIPRPFSKKSKLSVSLDQQFKVLQFLFIVRQIEGYQNIMKLSFIPLSYISYSAFSKTKTMSETSLPVSFSA